MEDHSGLELADPDRWGDVAAATLRGEGVTDGHVDLLFVTPETITELNVKHMGGSGPTDVLAFPMDAPQLAAGQVERVSEGVDSPPVQLGDIVICPEICSSQATSHVGSIDGEFCLLTIHAALHLIGHDHLTNEERETMQVKERRYLSSYGFDHPEGVPG